MAQVGNRAAAPLGQAAERPTVDVGPRVSTSQRQVAGGVDPPSQRPWRSPSPRPVPTRPFDQPAPPEGPALDPADRSRRSLSRSDEAPAKALRRVTDGSEW